MLYHQDLSGGQCWLKGFSKLSVFSVVSFFFTSSEMVRMIGNSVGLFDWKEHLTGMGEFVPALLGPGLEKWVRENPRWM